jgi:hypothetical protein
MQARKTYVVSVLILALTIFSVGYAQGDNARTGAGAVNDQNPAPQPASAGIAPRPSSLSGQSGVKAVHPQSPDAGRLTQSTVPSYFLYEMLFNNMAMLDRVADQDDKQGKHEMATRWRTHDQRGAGLNETEGAILKEIALDCNKAVQEQDAKINAVLQKLDAQRVPGVRVSPSPELVQLDQDRRAIIEAHIEKLREALGEGSFAKLDHYVRSEFHAEVTNPSSKPSSSNSHKENQ